MDQLIVRPLQPEDSDWMRQVLCEHWGSPMIITRGRCHQAEQLSGLVALLADQRVALATYEIREKACELVSLNILLPGHGIGTALVARLAELASRAGCWRLWLITTNDNLPALGFYQKRGFRLVAVHVDALTTSRQIKPEIPKIGLEGIPLRD
ncbi:MAG: GNAT family N-acetyltransferase [Anaerolineales bacterium]|nr:GNAT family N-acetyltransferase [Anaerolineales bacterium]